jgi:hypothetical protein
MLPTIVRFRTKGASVDPLDAFASQKQLDGSLTVPSLSTALFVVET